MLLCVGALSLGASVRALLELSLLVLLLVLLYVGAPDCSLCPPLQLFFRLFFSFQRTHAFVILIFSEVWGDTDEVGIQQGTVCFRPRPRCPQRVPLPHPHSLRACVRGGCSDVCGGGGGARRESVGSCVGEAHVFQRHRVTHTPQRHVWRERGERRWRDDGQTGGALLLGQTHAKAASEYGGPMQRVSMVALCHTESSDLGW